MNKIKIKNRAVQKKRCRQKSVEAVREEKVKLRGVGFVKEVGFNIYRPPSSDEFMKVWRLGSCENFVSK